MLESDQDRDDDLLILRTINIDAVFVMQGKHFLPDHSNDVFATVIQFEIEADDISPKLPAQSFNIGDVFYQMPEFIGKLELFAIRHRDKVALMKRKEFFLYMRHMSSGRVGDVCLVMERKKSGRCMVDDLLILVGNVDMVMQRKHF